MIEVKNLSARYPEKRIFENVDDSNFKAIRNAAKAVNIEERNIKLTQAEQGGFHLNLEELGEEQTLAIKNKLLDDTITKLTEAA